MSNELVSLRALVVSPDQGLRDLFRQASTSFPIPIEMVEAAGAAAVDRSFIAGIDLAYIDGALSPADLAHVVAATGTAAKPIFAVQLASNTAAESFEADGLAGKPSRLEEAKWLLERSMRVRVPSRVLVVDDSSTMRTIVRKTLAATRFPFEVSEAAAGLAALKLVREGEFHVVFLDYNMPDFDGLETLAEFKREQRGRVNVVMMTSTPHEELAERARSLGAAFLKKPFYPADIEVALAGFYGLRALNPKPK